MHTKKFMLEATYFLGRVSISSNSITVILSGKDYQIFPNRFISLKEKIRILEYEDIT